MNEKNTFIFIIAGTLFLVGFLVVLFATAEGATYYMKPAGDNGKSGLDTANAWQTMAYAHDQLQAGDTLFMLGSGAHFTGSNNFNIDWDSSGSSENEIVLKSIYGMAWFNGENNWYSGGESGWHSEAINFQNNVHHIIVDSIGVRNYGDSTNGHETYGFRCDVDANNITFRNCVTCTINAGGQGPPGYSLTTDVNAGFKLYGCHNVRVTNCSSFAHWDWIDTSTSPGNQLKRWSGQSASVIMHHNSEQTSHNRVDSSVCHNSAVGFLLKVGRCDSNIIEYCISHDNAFGYYYDGDANIFRYNVAYDIDSIGIHINSSTFDVFHDSIYNCTFSACSSHCIHVHEFGSLNVDSQAIFNNIFVSHDPNDYLCIIRTISEANDYTPLYLYMDHNCYYDNTQTDSCVYDSAHAMTLAEWVSYATDTVGFVVGKDSNAVFVNPVFQNEAGKDFHLTVNSPEAVKTGGLGGTYMGAYAPPEAGVTTKRFGKGSLGKGSF